MTDWRTLKDAPRDGRPVLLWGKLRPVPATWSWNSDDGCWDAVHELRPVVEIEAHGENVVFKTAPDSDFELWAPASPPD